MPYLPRRSVLTAAIAASVAWRGTAHAEGGLVAATFPGTWSEGYRVVVAPAYKKQSGAGVTQPIFLAYDEIARLTAAKGSAPPFDVVMLDEPQVIDASQAGLLEKFPKDKAPHFAELLPSYQGDWGPTISLNVVGLGYNPKRFPTPPTSWDVLWDPKYKGRVGLTALNSQLGIAFLAEINRLRGGTDADFEPAFKALKELMPNVGAVAANLGAFATLWQQEQIDIAPYNFNFVQTLKAKDVPVEFAVPVTGAVAWKTSLNLAAGTTQQDLALQYIDIAISPAVQAALQKQPYEIIPTNGTVPLEGVITTTLAKTQADLAKMNGLDWATINPLRTELIARFNREIKL